MSNELIKIKKRYGENMMHLCMKLFPTILETPDKLFNILSSLFAYSKFLCDDIKEYKKVDLFKDYVLAFANVSLNMVKTNKTPFELMSEAGYQLYECHTEKDVAKFSKYYKINERLCTFYSNRTYDHYVFFAVKNNVQYIKREKFSNPERQDEYGTSVISIQFTKGKINTLSIKNRYNHIVDNPDATFSNNLDNIIPGLTYSFKKYYNLNIFPEEKNFELPGYCLAPNGKLYKYNYYIDDIYYCVNNVIIDNNHIIEFEKEKYLIADYFIIDLVNKNIRLYDDYLNDSFETNFAIDKIIVTNKYNGKDVAVIGKNLFIEFELDKYNRIIAYRSNLNEIGDCFLERNKTLKYFQNLNLEYIGNDFLPRNNTLQIIDIPNVKEIGNSFLEQNSHVYDVSFPNLQKVGSLFMRDCLVDKIDFPKLEIIGNSFMSFNVQVSKLNLPKLRKVGGFFLNNCYYLREINLPLLEEVGRMFLSKNHGIASVNLPNLVYIDDGFLEFNISLMNISLPKVIVIGDNFLCNNYMINKAYFPLLKEVGANFLNSADSIEEIDISSLENDLEFANKQKKLVKKR